MPGRTNRIGCAVRTPITQKPNSSSEAWDDQLAMHTVSSGTFPVPPKVERDFDRAHKRAFIQDALSFLRHGTPDLLSFEAVCERLGLGPEGGATEDGLFTVEEVVCIAACDKAPCLQINLEYYENLTDEQIDEVLDRLRKEAEAEKQSGRVAK